MSLNYTSVIFILLIFIGCKNSQNQGLEQEAHVYQPTLDEIILPLRVAFGSCNKLDEPQILWDDILKENADLWVWLGDIIYGDTEDLTVLETKYNLQKKRDDYSLLLHTIPVTGIWDDHDFGSNNAGKEYPSKQGSRDLLFNFLDVPQDHPSWDREGAYRQHYLGKNEEVNLILLDSRYFRDPPNYDYQSRNYTPNTTGTILGDAQWTWLEDKLANSTSKVHLIANGIQVIPEDHRFEKWSNFPRERYRLFDLIMKYNIEKPVLISGDRHLSEVSKITWKGHSIYEVTSSGMTHSYENVGQEPNRYRISQLVSEKSYAILEFDWENHILTVKLKGDAGFIYDELTLDF